MPEWVVCDETHAKAARATREVITWDGRVLNLCARHVAMLRDRIRTVERIDKSAPFFSRGSR